jgi:hypothetical protein
MYPGDGEIIPSQTDAELLEVETIEVEQVSRTETVVREFDERNVLIKEAIYSTTVYQPKMVIDVPTGQYL